MTINNKILILILLLAALLPYINSLQNQFVWDDEDWILKNSNVKDWHKWPFFFAQNSIQGARKGSNFYRPLQAISHGIDYLLWGYRPFGHHVSNVALHAFTAIAVFLLLRNIFSAQVAFLTAIFFATHPAHTEAITYISGRADPMSALLIILAVLFFERHLFVSCVFYVFAILSKESALIAPFLMLLYASVRGIDTRSTLKKIIPFAVIAFIYGALRLTILDFSGTIPENAPKAFFYVPIYIRSLTFLKALPVYFKILLWPFGLHMERDISLSYSIFQPQTLVGFLIMSVMFLSGVREIRRNKVFIFSAAWFFISIFPNSNLVPINALIYEHWLYLPSIAFFLLLAWTITSLFRKGRALRLFSVFISFGAIVFFTWRTVDRNKEWKDPVTFYESTMRYKDDSLRLHNNLAMAYMDAGREEDAIREYKKAIDLGDYYPQPRYNLSKIYSNKGDYDAAIRELKKSIEIDNDFLYSHESLALIYFNQKSFDEAKKEAEFILEKEPDNRIGLEILKKFSD